MVFGFCFFLATALFVAFWIIQGRRTHDKKTSEHRELHRLILSLLPAVTTKPGDKAGILILKLYSADCWLCHLEAASYTKYQDELQQAVVVFASFDSPRQIRKFARKHKLDSHENTHVLQLNPSKLPEAFRFPLLPSMYIYGPGGELLFSSRGATPWERLIEWMKTQTL